MIAVLCWSLFSLVLLFVIPDRWQARREIAKRRSVIRRRSLRAPVER
jgi:hypothetical protein